MGTLIVIILIFLCPLLFLVFSKKTGSKKNTLQYNSFFSDDKIKRKVSFSSNGISPSSYFLNIPLNREVNQDKGFFLKESSFVNEYHKDLYLALCSLLEKIPSMQSSEVTVDSRIVQVNKIQYPLIVSEELPICFDDTYFFFPEMIVIVNRNNKSVEKVIGYGSDLFTVNSFSDSCRLEKVPDGVIPTSTRWLHSRLDGQRDRRYRENYLIAYFSSHTFYWNTIGLKITIADKRIADKFLSYIKEIDRVVTGHKQ